MDLPGQDPQELREDLQNLERLNRRFGATAVMKKAFAALTRDGSARVVLDLCCGFGDHDRTMVAEARQAGRPVTILALDFQMDTLRLAQEATGADPDIIYIQADSRHLPFATKSVDAVTCSLALHHFSDEDACTVLREMVRVGRNGLACIDLVRSRLAACSIWLLTTLIMRNRITQHDARLSVRRAFSYAEFKALGERAGWGSMVHWRLPWFRQAIVKMPDGKV
jgi:ubiquinone/menaquinone biosynthesis C-methylase UbiE